jgi:FkbM family methyltransferase
MMKSILKRSLGRATARLPWGAREAIFDALCAKFGPAEVIARAAPRAGIAGITAVGRYGEIRSAPSDTTVFWQYARSGEWARRTNDTLIEFFANRGGTYIDVGANIGLTTIPVAQNSAVRCVAVEPEPTNYANLVANVRLNCTYGNVETHQIAVFDKATTLRFELASRNLGDHRIRTTEAAGLMGEQDRPVIEVSGRPLREVVGQATSPLAIKIDTQGAEPFVVAGGQDIIASAELLLLEFWPYGMRRAGGDPMIVIDTLRGFRSFSIAVGEDEVAREMTAAEAFQLLTTCTAGQVAQSTYYLDVVARR